MKPKNRSKRGGTSMIEFTFVGIPIIFVLISVFEMSRGMWMYHTAAYSVKQGVRYASVHGYNCSHNGNTCAVTIGQVAKVIQDAAVGLDPSATSLNFWSGPSGPSGVSKTLIKNCATMTVCISNVTTYPSITENDVGQPFTIDLQVPFTSALAMFWPGAKPVTFSQTIFPASSTDTVKF